MIKIAVTDNKQFVDAEFDRIVGIIKSNAERGNPVSEFGIPVHLAADVKERLAAEVEGVQYQTMDRRPNAYTGKIQSFVSRTEDGVRYYKIRIGR
jgi:hypothetical protein